MIAARAVKKMKKSLNTELDQIFSDMPAGEQAALDRPETNFGRRKVVFIIILLSALIIGLWFYFGRAKSLADNLPVDVEFYVALELPAQDTWYERFKFWASAPRVDSSPARLYQRLNLLGWDAINFSEHLLPLFAGQMELARLAGGGLVFKTSLTDKAGWLKLAKSEANNYRDQVLQTLAVTPIGWWAALAALDSKIYWLTDGADLYLSDRADILAGIKNKPTQPLSGQLGNSFIKPDLLTVYVSNLAFLDKLVPAYAAPVQATLAGPLVLKANLDGQNLVWSTLGGSKVSTPAANNGADYDLTVFAHDFSQAYAGWKNILTQVKSGLLSANVGRLEQIAKEFYHLDIQSFSQKLGKRELAYYSASLGFKPQASWLFLAKGDKEPSDTGIETALEALGSSLFAITHPRAVARTLSDGSTMVELRADIDGLDWQPYVWTAAGQEYNLKSLNGQGESQGFYTGYVPNLGYVLTNQMEFLTKVARLPAEPSCVAGNETELGAVISPHLLTSDALVLEIVKNIAISATRNGQLAGCLAF